MRNKKVIGIVLLAVGIVVTVVALAANQLGIGIASVFGYKQSLGAVLGAAITAAGFFLTTGNVKLTGILLLVGGVVLLAASLSADMLGLGITSGFGYNQIIGSFAGVLSAVIGYFLVSRK